MNRRAHGPDGRLDQVQVLDRVDHDHRRALRRQVSELLERGPVRRGVRDELILEAEAVEP